MGNLTDEQFAWEVLKRRLKQGNLNGLSELDCVKTLMESSSLDAKKLVCSKLDSAIKIAESGHVDSLIINQAKILKAYFKRDTQVPQSTAVSTKT